MPNPPSSTAYKLPTFSPLKATMTRQEDEARQFVRDLSAGAVEVADVESLIADIADNFAVKPVEVDLAPIQMKHEEINNSFAEIPEPKNQVIRFEFIANCNESAQWLVDDPMNGHWGTGAGHRLKRFYSVPVTDADPTSSALATWRNEMKISINACNKLISAHRARMLEQLRKMLVQRKQTVLKIHNSARLLGIPLSPVSTPVSIPVTRRSLTLAEVEKRSQSGEPDHVLVEEIAAELVRTMRSFGSALEHQPVVAARILREDEESLRDVLLFILNANWERVGGETFMGAGKTDILFPWSGRNAFIGECKIWSGESNFTKAIDQLLSYLVWRDVRAGLIIFIRDRQSVGEIIEKARDNLRTHPQFKHETFAEDEFVLSSNTDSDRSIRVSLIAVPLPSDSGAEPA